MIYAWWIFIILIGLLTCMEILIEMKEDNGNIAYTILIGILCWLVFGVKL